jgi:predicted dehydrogenase
LRWPKNIIFNCSPITSWYSSNKLAWQKIHDENEIGDIRKIVFHTGHQGPIEIGCPPEFLEWLTDPVKNGGGAITDFGCYGADITNRFMQGQAPLTVTAVTQQMKPDKYPKVDDEATIILTYPKTQVIIQASWNWPFGRKDMEVYGSTGYIFALDKTNMKELKTGAKTADTFAAPPLPAGQREPFEYFAGVIRGSITVKPFEFSSIENNEMVVKILEAAKTSAKTGKTIVWKDYFKE